MPPLLVIAGPTATGKTALAIEVASSLRASGLPAEIISADSRQVFRGLDIGTAKPTPAERLGIPHHGLDLVAPDEAFSVADFVAHVATVLPGIGASGGVAILVGGTGFYLRAIARGLDTAALPSGADTRRAVEDLLLRDGLGAAAERLTSLAPGLAARTDLRNPRRVARALEIAELTGDVALPPPRPYDAPIAWVGLDVDRETHRRWIASRARGQFDAGLLDEARELRARFDPTLPAFSAIGYREAWAVLDGTLSRDQAVEADAARNVAFARRQRTWFRSEPDIEWQDASSPSRARDRTLEIAHALVDAATPASTAALARPSARTPSASPRSTARSSR